MDARVRESIVMLKIFIILIVVAFFLAVGSAILEAYLEVRKKPKEEMYWCPNGHGYFRKKHCLPLFPELGGTAQNSFVCPQCYKKAVFDDPNKRLYQ